MTDPMTVHHEDATPVADLSYDNNRYPIKFNDIPHNLSQDIAREALIFEFDGDNQDRFIDLNYKPAGHTLMSIIPVLLLANAEVIRQRLVHYKYLKFDAIKIKLTWNTGINLDGQGILWYDFAPGLDTSCENLTCVSGIPGSVIANYSVTNSVELSIPWWLPSDKINIPDLLSLNGEDPSNYSEYNISARLNFSHIFVPFLQNQHLHFNVYASFENPRVEGQTLNQEEMDLRQQMKQMRRERYQYYAQANNNLAVEPLAQGRSGVISDIANTVGTVADAVSGLPVIGEVAGLVSTASNIIGGIAGFFGFGKPHSIETTRKVIQRPYQGLGIPVVDDLSENLANQPLSHVDPKFGNFITDKDEMDFEYIGSNSAIVDQFNFNMEDGHGTELWHTVLTPRQLLYKDKDPINFTTGQFVAANFDLVSFEYVELEFILSKTAFHNGVIEVSYMPVTSVEGGEIHRAGGDEIQSVLKTEIHSITNETRFVVRVPLIYETRWVRNDTPFASIMVRVISPLSLNENVNPNVRVNVALSYKGLRCCTFRPQIFDSDSIYFENSRRISLQRPFARRPAPSSASSKKYDYVAQVNIGTAEDASLATFGTPEGITDLDVAVTTGDITRNLRPLTRIFATGDSTYFSEFAEDKLLERHAYMDPEDYFDIGDGDYLYRFPNAFLMCAQLFWFNRGGMRFKISSKNQDLDSRNMILAYPYRYWRESFMSGFYNLANVARNDILQVELPQGSEARFFYANERFSYTVNKTSVRVMAEAPMSDRYFYAGADDFSFMGLHGVPSLTIRDEAVYNPYSRDEIRRYYAFQSKAALSS
jgi:hypothetical protein